MLMLRYKWNDDSDNNRSDRKELGSLCFIRYSYCLWSGIELIENWLGLVVNVYWKLRAATIKAWKKRSTHDMLRKEKVASNKMYCAHAPAPSVSLGVFKFLILIQIGLNTRIQIGLD